VDSPIQQLMHTKSESALHPEYHDTVLAVTENFFLYRSTDKGQTWELVTLPGVHNKATKLYKSPSKSSWFSISMFLTLFSNA
jgi:hypothetical protein